VVNGARVETPERGFEEKNAALWSPARAVELGYCPPVN
jgi:hypothetical protein